LGSVCRRQDTGMVESLVRDLHAQGIRLHGFGFKVLGLARCARYWPRPTPWRGRWTRGEASHFPVASIRSVRTAIAMRANGESEFWSLAKPERERSGNWFSGNRDATRRLIWATRPHPINCRAKRERRLPPSHAGRLAGKACTGKT
jgi:hypothetical protein